LAGRVDLQGNLAFSFSPPFYLIGWERERLERTICFLSWFNTAMGNSYWMEIGFQRTGIDWERQKWKQEK